MSTKMNREETLIMQALTVDAKRHKVRQRLLNPLVCSIGASVGIFGGISSLVAGLLCVVLHVVAIGDQIFDRAGTVLLILGIPMLLLGSIFLDEIEVKQS